MHTRSIATLFMIVLLALTATAVEAVKPEDNQSTREKGRKIYERSCLFCHVAEGKGNGPAGWFIGRYEAPHPRNFTSEWFKLRSTESGSLPTDQDLFRTVTQAIPGYLPSFGALTEEERWQVIAYVKSFNLSFKDAKPEPMVFGNPPFPSSNESIEKGRKRSISNWLCELSRCGGQSRREGVTRRQSERYTRVADTGDRFDRAHLIQEWSDPGRYLSQHHDGIRWRSDAFL